MATKTKARKGAIERVVASAADAAEELGAAATSFKESWRHVQKARSKARPATRAATRVGKAAVRTAKRTAGRAMGKKKSRR